MAVSSSAIPPAAVPERVDDVKRSIFELMQTIYPRRLEEDIARMEDAKPADASPSAETNS